MGANEPRSVRTIWIGLGANLGDPAANVRRAAELLAGRSGVHSLRLSPLYDTAPWGMVEQPWFVNAVAEVETSLRPSELLHELLAIERSLGRVRSQRWGPRPIDLDYVLDAQLTVDEPGLTVPHPGLEDRASVLVPLADLRPEMILPSGRAIAVRIVELGSSQAIHRRA